jgi:hypothetical protein
MDKVKLVNNFMTQEDCNFFIKWIDENQNDQSKFRHRVGVAFNKGLAVRAIFPDEKPPVIFKDIEDICMKYANKFMDLHKELLPSEEEQYFYGFSLTKLSQDIQLRLHQDVHSEFTTLSNSGVIYLNDDYVGGESCFLEEFEPRSFFPLYEDSMGGLTYKPKAGDIGIFPANIWHGGKKVESGDRYAIVLWATTDKEVEFEGFDSDKVLHLINYKPVASE